MGGSPRAQNSDSDNEPIDGVGPSSPASRRADRLERLLLDSPVRHAQDGNRRPPAPSADEWLDLFADGEHDDPDRPLSAVRRRTSPPHDPGRRSKPDDPIAYSGLEHLFTTVRSDGDGRPTTPGPYDPASSIGAPKPVHRRRPLPATQPPPPTGSTPSNGFVFLVDGERRHSIIPDAGTTGGPDIGRGPGVESGPGIQRGTGRKHLEGERLARSVLGDVAWPALIAQPPSRSVRSPGQARRRLPFLPEPVVEFGSRPQIWGVVVAATMLVAGAGAWSIGALDRLGGDGPVGVTLSGTTEGVTPAAPIDDRTGHGSSARARSGGLGPVSSLVSGTQGTSGVDDAESDTISQPGTGGRARTTVAEPSDGGSDGSVAGTSSTSTETTSDVTSSSVPTTTTSTSLTSGSGSGSTSSTSTTSTTRPETTTTASDSSTTTASTTSTSMPSSTTTSVSTTTTTSTTGTGSTPTDEPSGDDE